MLAKRLCQLRLSYALWEACPGTYLVEKILGMLFDLAQMRRAAALMCDKFIYLGSSEKTGAVWVSETSVLC